MTEKERLLALESEEREALLRRDFARALRIAEARIALKRELSARPPVRPRKKGQVVEVGQILGERFRKKARERARSRALGEAT